ncbi:ABC transporter permease subunit [Nannocystis bainbridge]|uniref:ABC transporter permease subunit n=1 Tax=Nannocystis bainbridge TaxID=2995303 RepID=A0ABT5E4P9_9BACT|nr:ABC transporter permease subunit [Nannocystis bainbridge]MDC0720380.1 ABC transporter permease subunit [Nannocystis bainbridge]
MSRPHAALWLAGLLLWAFAALAAPAAGLVLAAAEPGTPVRLPTLLAIAGDSLVLAAALAGLALALAYPLARAVTAPWLLLFVMIAPLARAIGALALGLSPGTGAVALARLAGDVPLAALLLRARLRTRPRSWLDAAADLGAGPWRRFVTVEWPHLRPAYALAAVCLVLLALGDATIAAVAGGGKRFTLGLALREAVLLDAHPRRAAAIAALFAAIAVPCAWALARGLRAAGRSRDDRQPPAARAGLAVLVVCAAPIAALVVPAVTWPLGQGDALLAAQLPATLASAGASAVLAAALGCVTGLAAPARWSPALLLPLALPPAVYGAAWLVTAQQLGWRPGPLLTFVTLLPGQVAIAHAGAAAAFADLGRLADAARDLGAGPAARARWLWWPLARPIGAALALVAFALALGDAGAAGFTSGPGGSTLAVGLEILGRGGDLGAVPRWALALGLVPLLAAALAALLRRR